MLVSNITQDMTTYYCYVCLLVKNMIHTFALQSLHFQEENFLNLQRYTLIETPELYTLKWQLMVVWFIYKLL